MGRSLRDANGQSAAKTFARKSAYAQPARAPVKKPVIVRHAQRMLDLAGPRLNRSRSNSPTASGKSAVLRKREAALTFIRPGDFFSDGLINLML